MLGRSTPDRAYGADSSTNDRRIQANDGPGAVAPGRYGLVRLGGGACRGGLDEAADGGVGEGAVARVVEAGGVTVGAERADPLLDAAGHSRGRALGGLL